MENILAVKSRTDYLNFFFIKQPTSETKHIDVERICDICGRKQYYTKVIFSGAYTGVDMWTTPYVFENKIKEGYWGHKSNVFHYCEAHKEREIDEKIKELKENE